MYPLVSVFATQPRIIIINNIMKETSIQHYRGYAVKPSALRLTDTSYSANLLLERTGGGLAGTQYSFYALNYFDDAPTALAYSRRWARNWIDTRG